LLVRSRIILANIIILTTILTIFGCLGFFMSEYASRSDIEESLVAVSRQLLAPGAAAGDGRLTPAALSPEQLTLFFVSQYNGQGELVENLADNPFHPDLSPHLDLQRQDNYFTTFPYGDYQLYALTIPFGDDGSFLRIARYYDDFVPVGRIVFILGSTGVSAILLSLLIGSLVLGRILKPLDDMTAVALRIHRANDLSRRFPDFGRSDEISRLALVLNQTLDRLESLFRTQQRLLTDVSHELRTPLTTIRGNIELMRRMGGPPNQEMLNDTQDEVARMTRLVDDLMLLARADAGGLPIQRKPVELDTVFLDVFRRMKPVAECVELSLEGMDQVCVLGDADRLKQLMLNLVDNGLKYTPPGGKVSMSLSKLNGVAQVIVADNGIGIAEDDLSLIFERFYRADKARTRIHGGSGLGLSIVRWLVEAHGGQISVDSELGEGTTFTVTLPVYALPPYADRRPLAPK
jgi:signal transduction histidine kinase